MSNPQSLFLHPGAPFEMENGGAEELLLDLTTPAGSVIHISLPPGGRIRIDPVLEKFTVDGTRGAGPGIEPLRDPAS